MKGLEVPLRLMSEGERGEGAVTSDREGSVRSTNLRGFTSR